MKQLTNASYYVISAERKELSKEANAERTIQLGNMLKGLKGTVCRAQGKFEGRVEASYIVVPSPDMLHARGILLEIGAVFEQACILEVGSGGEAYFINYDGDAEYGGEARTDRRPHFSDDYTEYEDDGQTKYLTLNGGK